MKFIESGIDRWNSGPYTIAKYDDGFYAYQYFRYSYGGRDSKRLHRVNEPLPSKLAAERLCIEMSAQPVPKNIRLIDAPFMIY